jgi:hypothetical protein
MFLKLLYFFLFLCTVRSGTGVELWKPVANFYIPDEQFVHDESKNCRAIAFSPDGRYFAWVNGFK